MTKDPRASGRRRPRKPPAGGHVPVLVREVLRALAPAPGEIVADCTLGAGGHARELLKRIGPEGRLIGLDVDARAIRAARRALGDGGGRNCFFRRNFAELPAVLAAEGIEGVDVLLADLGVSSMQVDDPARGISYKCDGPLDVRMDDRLERTGADLLATISLEDLSAALRDLADEPDHQRIAEWILQQRQAQPIERVEQLSRLVLHAKGVVPSRAKRPRWNEYGSQHPAARTFQALRILVNGEMENLERFLAAAPACLRKGGRVGVISFHSGEDRRVKRAFRAGLEAGDYAEICPRPLTPGGGERHRNPRSASAKFRWARK